MFIHYKYPSTKYLICVLWTFSGCIENGGTNDQLTSLNDLSKYGIPVSIPLPKECIIKQSPVSYEKGVIITAPHLNMQIDIFKEYADSDKNSTKIKNRLLAEKQSEDDYQKLILDESQGFIFQTKDNDLGEIYHFFYVTIKNEVQIEFKEGIPQNKNLTYEEIANMYNLSKRAQ